MRMNAEQQVIASLLSWYREHGRHSLPWRHTRDPYRILVSELMLQQTQVSRVQPKYEAFTSAFPTIGALAHASRHTVLTHWQGLGYNSRAVRFHALAKLIASGRAGKLPETRDELMALPGIGPYTAGAVIIFSQRKPSLSVDVNIERVLKRVFFTPKAAPRKAEVDALQLRLITASGKPHHWHAALMDIGSAICTARKPKCASCPLLKQCNTRGVRPDEMRAVPKQSRFPGSTRWWRGQALKTLLQGPIKERHLLHRIKERPDADDEARFEAAIAAMIAEGIIERHRGDLRIAL